MSSTDTATEALSVWKLTLLFKQLCQTGHIEKDDTFNCQYTECNYYDAERMLVFVWSVLEVDGFGFILKWESPDHKSCQWVGPRH